MFGYIDIDRKRLSERGQKIYDAYYCGLCRMLKNVCGKKGQILLNRDIIYMIALLSGLYDLDWEESEFICPKHPTRKQTSWINEATAYAAHVSVMLAYHNLVSDRIDEHNYTKRTLSGMLQKDYQKLAGVYPRQSRAIECYIDEKESCQSREEPNIELAAEPMGELIGELLAWKEDRWYQELRTMGFYLGKYIYLMDAYEELTRDERMRRYNPLSSIKRENQKDCETIFRLMMNSMIRECICSFEKLPAIPDGEIVENILCAGVWEKFEAIRQKKQK